MLPWSGSKKMWVMVRVCEPTVTCADPVAANSESSPTVVLVAKNCLFPERTSNVSFNEKLLLPVPVLMVPPPRAVSEPDRVQVVFPEPRSPSTLTIKAALAVAQASARPISVTRRLAWRSGEVVSSFCSFQVVCNGLPENSKQILCQKDYKSIFQSFTVGAVGHAAPECKIYRQSGRPG